MNRPDPLFEGRRATLLGSLLGWAVSTPGASVLGLAAAALHAGPAGAADVANPANPANMANTAKAAPGHGAALATAPLPLAPDFTLRGIGSPNLRLAEQRGQVVLLNFWASWAGASKLELPQLNRLFSTYRREGLVLWGLNLDTDPTVAQAFAQRMGLIYPQLHDTDKSVARQYALDTLPATVLIDRDGQVRYAYRGWSEGQDAVYERHIRELVKG